MTVIAFVMVLTGAGGMALGKLRFPQGLGLVLLGIVAVIAAQLIGV